MNHIVTGSNSFVSCLVAFVMPNISTGIISFNHALFLRCRQNRKVRIASVVNCLEDIASLTLFPSVARFPLSPTWEQRKLGELITELSSGKSVNSEKGTVGPSDIGILKTSCVSYDMFDPTECKKVVEAEARMVSCPVEAGTLIVSRMNTPDRVGACGFVSGDLPNLFLPDRLWKVKLTLEVDPYLIFVLLVSDSNKARLKGMASGTSGSMHNIPKESFENLDVTLPRKSKEQRAIGLMFEQLDHLITLHQCVSSLAKTN